MHHLIFTLKIAIYHHICKPTSITRNNKIFYNLRESNFYLTLSAIMEDFGVRSRDSRLQDSPMTSMFGHNIRSDLLILYAAESLVVFLACYLLMAWAVPAPSPPGGAAVDHARLALVAAVVALCFGLASGASGLYQAEVLARARRLALGGAVATVLLVLAVWGCLQLIAMLGHDVPSPRLVLALVLGAMAAAMSVRLGHALVARSGLLNRRLLLIQDSLEQAGAGSEAETALRDAPSVLRMSLAAPTGPRLTEALRPAWLRAQNIWAVVVPDGTANATLRRHCAEAGVRVLTEEEFLECRLTRVAFERLPNDWLATARCTRQGALEAAARRTLDITVALLLLLATLPVMLVAALAIRLDSKGPIFYRQERSGLHLRPFTLIKFRSMVVDAEAGGTPRWASKGDPRVTAVGRFLRLTRIDELPQLLNVLRGDMSMVGPRPERPGFVAQLGEIIPHYNDRASVKPGITGWAQVNYPYGASIEDARMKLAYDLYYVRRRSLFLDLLILVATVRVVLFQEGAR
jgi:exopolysaccharide biosynthesis polyprenyl glycosylphosphotransferase